MTILTLNGSFQAPSVEEQQRSIAVSLDSTPLNTADPVLTNTLDTAVMVQGGAAVVLDPTASTSSPITPSGDVNTDNLQSLLTEPPSVEIVVDGPFTLKNVQRTVTFQFNRAVRDFTIDDVVLGDGVAIKEGSFKQVEGDPTRYTAILVSTADVGQEFSSSVRVKGASYTDALNQQGTGNFQTFEIDTKAPIGLFSATQKLLNDANTKQLYTLTFTEDVMGFDQTDLVVSGVANGGIENFKKVDERTYTFDVTVKDGLEGALSVALKDASFTDLKGNDGIGGRSFTAVDTFNPLASLKADLLRASDAKPTITYTLNFSEDVFDADGGAASDLKLDNFVFSGVSLVGNTFDLIKNSARSYTLKATVADGEAGSLTFSLLAGSYKDAAGNFGGAASATTLVDRKGPVITVFDAIGPISDAQPEARFVIEFSEAVLGFTSSDLKLAGIADAFVKDFTRISETRFEFNARTPDAVKGALTVSVANGSYTDLSGNTGDGGMQSVLVDRENPTGQIKFLGAASQATPLVKRFSVMFSEAVKDLGLNDFTVTGIANKGASNLSIAADRKSATVDVEVLPNQAGKLTLKLASSYSDDVGNTGNVATLTVPVDDAAPTAILTALHSELTDARLEQRYTLDFSEAVDTLTASAIRVSGASNSGVLSFKRLSATRYTFSVKVDAEQADGNLVVELPASAYKDASGQLGATTASATTRVDVSNPVATIVGEQKLLTDSAPLQSYTVKFSEAVKGFTQSDLRLNGADRSGIQAFKTIKDGLEYSFTARALDNSGAPLTVEIAQGAFTDASGNKGAAARHVTLVDTINPQLRIVDDQMSVRSANRMQTFKLTSLEALDGLTASDVLISPDSVANSGVLNFRKVSADLYVFDVEVDVNQKGSLKLSVANGSFTDAAGNAGLGATLTKAVDTSVVAVDIQTFSPQENEETGEALVSYLFTFDRAVTGFSKDDLEIESALRNFVLGELVDVTAGSNLPAGQQRFRLDVTVADDQAGSLVLKLKESAVFDAEGVSNFATAARLVNVDTSNSSGTLTNDQAEQIITGADRRVKFTATFTKPVVDVTVNDIAILNGTLVADSLVFDRDSQVATFEVDVSSQSNGTLTVGLESTIQRVDGARFFVEQSLLRFDTRGPSVSVDVGNEQIVGTSSSKIARIIFDQKVFDFDITDIELSTNLRLEGDLVRFSDTEYRIRVAGANDVSSDEEFVRVKAGGFTDQNGNPGAGSEIAIQLIASSDVNAKTGTSGNDTSSYFGASDGIDILSGAAGNDSIVAKGGNDELYGDAGNDRLDAGDGDDLLDGGDGIDTLLGGIGNDFLDGGNGSDRFEAGDGNDTLIGGIGLEETLFGGNGDDLIEDEDGVSFVDAGLGSDNILLDFSERSDSGDVTIECDNVNFEPQHGSDNVSISTSVVIANGINVFLRLGHDFFLAEGRFEKISVFGENGNDTITTSSGNDSIGGGEGDDLINAGAGDDSLDGGKGADSIQAGAGNDAIDSVGSDDTIDGGDGIDQIKVAGNAYTLESDEQLQNVERISSRSNSGSLMIDLSRQTEAFLVELGGTADTIRSSQGADTLVTGGGDDSLFIGTNDVVDAGIGRDTVNIDADYDEADERLENVEILKISGNALGVKVNLTRQMGEAFAVILSGAGDTVITGTEADSIEAGAGNDQIFAGAGNDTIVSGNGGVDLIDGGAGTDVLRITGGSAFAPASDEALEGIETLELNVSGSGSFSLDLSKQAGESFRVAVSSQSARSCEITMADGDDVVTGSLGSDKLNGGAGNDTLIGGLGADTLVGGAGNDVFAFDARATSVADRITDFISGSDVLDFSVFGIDGNTTSNTVSDTAYLTSNPDTSVNMSGGIFRLVDIAGGDNIMTSSGLLRALGSSGEFRNLDLGSNGKAIVIASQSESVGLNHAYLVTANSNGDINSVSHLAILEAARIENYMPSDFRV